MSEQKPKSLPKSLAACADLYFSIKEARLAKDKESEVLKAEENRIKEHIINNLPKSEASGIAGKVVRVQVVMKSAPRVADWSEVYKAVVQEYQYHVKRRDGLQDGAFALLQRRIGEAAVREMWNDGRTVAGVERFDFPDLSVSKLK